MIALTSPGKRFLEILEVDIGRQIGRTGSVKNMHNLMLSKRLPNY